MPRLAKRFVAMFHFVDWSCIGFGVHVCFAEPNIEIHLPFGFVRVGWQTISLDFVYGIDDDCALPRTFGLDGYRSRR